MPPAINPPLIRTRIPGTVDDKTVSLRAARKIMFSLSIADDTFYSIGYPVPKLLSGPRADKAGAAVRSPRAMTLTVGQKATRGIFLGFAQTIFSKLIMFIGQVVLAYLLMPEHFTTVALAGTVTTVLDKLQ